MRQVFLLVVVLIGVIAAMFVLNQRSKKGRGEVAAPGGVARVSVDGGIATSPSGVTNASALTASAADAGSMRVVALTRLIPRYAVALPAAEPAEMRAKVLEQLKKHGGQTTGAMPADPRAPFAAQVPHAKFKKLLRDLGLGNRPVLITPRGEVPHAGGIAVVLLELSLPAPSTPR